MYDQYFSNGTRCRIMTVELLELDDEIGIHGFC